MKRCFRFPGALLRRTLACGGAGLGLMTLALFADTAPKSEEVEGLVRPVEHASVASPVLQEVIDAVMVKEGDQVTKDQVLVRLRDSKEKLAVEEAKNLVEQADFVDKGLKSLLDSHMGSKEQWIKADTDLKLAKLKLELAEEQLKEKTIRAPFAGIVVTKYKEVGESVDRVEKLVDLVNIDQVYVRYFLDPKYMQTLHVGEEVTVHFPALNGAPFTGKIDFIAPEIDAPSNLFLLRLLIDNPDHKIKGGMRGMADFSRLAGR